MYGKLSTYRSNSKLNHIGGRICKHFCEEIEETTNAELFPLPHGFPSKLIIIHFISSSFTEIMQKIWESFLWLSLFFFSFCQGVPMIYMGDEYGHTKEGNNNTYCHDNYVIISLLFILCTSSNPVIDSFWLWYRLITSGGTRRKILHQTSSDSAAWWPNSASKHLWWITI